MSDMSISICGHLRADTVAEVKTLHETSLGYWPCLSIGDIAFHGNRENFERLHALLGRWLDGEPSFVSDKLGAPPVKIEAAP